MCQGLARAERQCPADDRGRPGRFIRSSKGLDEWSIKSIYPMLTKLCSDYQFSFMDLRKEFGIIQELTINSLL